MTLRSQTIFVAILMSVVVVLSPAAVAGVVDITKSDQSADETWSVQSWGGVLAIVGSIVLALLKIVPQVIALLARASALIERIEHKLDADEKRNGDLFTKILLSAADRHGKEAPPEPPAGRKAE